jgi:tetratricopeptide (TPR) repeat protein
MMDERKAKIQGAAAVIVAVGGAASWTQPSVAGSDLWWHLAAGRDILAHGRVPSSDVFSHTFAGRPWTNHEWLWDVIYASAGRVDPQWVAWLNFGVVLLLLALFYSVARRESGSRLGAGAALWLAAATAHWYFDIRPHLWSLLGVALLLRTRTWPGAPWLWPPLFAAWANLHAGFAFGLGVMGLLVLVRVLDESRARGRPVVPIREACGAAAAGLAILANPSGIEILSYPLAYLDSSSPFRSIVEWLPADVTGDPRTYAGRIWIGVALCALSLPVASGRSRGAPALAAAAWALAVAVLARAGATWLALAVAVAIPAFALRDRGLLPALALVGVAMAATSRRFAPLFAFLSTPVLAQGLAAALAQAQARFAPLRDPRAALGAALAAGVVALALWRGIGMTPDLLARWTQDAYYPYAALRWLEVAIAPSRMFNHYNWGGLVMLRAPSLRVFIDGRANTLYDDAIYREYHQIASGAPGADALLARRGIDAVFVPAEGALARTLPATGWQLVYEDRLAAILLPPNSPRLTRRMPDASEVLGDDPELRIMRARAAAARGDYDSATRDAEEALRRAPLLVPGYAELARVRALAGDLPGITRAIERGLAADPRSEERLREFEGYCYEIAGDLPRAVAALRRARSTGPFRGPEGIDRYIANLEARIARGDAGGAR